MTMLFDFAYRKSRIVHRCDVCGCDIPRGTTYHYQRSAYDGVFSSWHVHPDCAEMHWHHNKGREGDDQCDDYLGYEEYRGRWPHAYTRLELRSELAHIAWEAQKKGG